LISLIKWDLKEFLNYNNKQGNKLLNLHFEKRLIGLKINKL